MNSPEVKEIPRIDILNGYLDESIDEVKALVEQYPREVVKDWDELNRLFQRSERCHPQCPFFRLRGQQYPLVDCKPERSW